jgi:hypothetical protein
LILADTSVWIDHFRRGNARLAHLLESSEVLCHPFVVGELACGNLSSRRATIPLLRSVPEATPATDAEAQAFIDARRLMGRGLGYVDVHLLASASLEGARLWTLDRRLARAAGQLGLEG